MIAVKTKNNWNIISLWGWQQQTWQIQPQPVNTACHFSSFFNWVFMGVTNRFFTRHWRPSLVHCPQIKISTSNTVFPFAVLNILTRSVSLWLNIFCWHLIRRNSKILFSNVKFTPKSSTHNLHLNWWEYLVRI